MREVLPRPADHVGPRTVPPFDIVPGIQSRDSHFFEPSTPESSRASMFIFILVFCSIYFNFSVADLFHLTFVLALPELVGGVLTSLGIHVRTLQLSNPPSEKTGRKRRRGRTSVSTCTARGMDSFGFTFF